MAELTKNQKATMKKHSKHHTSRHMRMMTSLMQKGKSFTAAHKETKKELSE